MPFIFKAQEDISKLIRFKSVLIIPCRFCPAASSAVKSDTPYFEFWRNFLQTKSYEHYIKSLKSELEEARIRTAVFRSRLLHQFVLCMWTSGRRKKLLEYSRGYEALLVLGCEAATQTVRDSVKSIGCEVIQGLESEGIMSIQPKITWPLNLRLKLESVTPLIFKNTSRIQSFPND